jgi:hypothetical protein
MAKQLALKYDNQTLARLLLEDDEGLTLDHDLTLEELRMLPLVTPVDDAKGALKIRKRVLPDARYAVFYDDRDVEQLQLGCDEFGLLDVRDPKELAGLRTKKTPWPGARDDEFVLEIGPFQKIRIYKERVQRVYDQVDVWLRNMSLRAKQRPHTVTEDVYGSYGISLLEIRDTQGRLIATMLPTGAAVIGAEGRVELQGSVDREGIIYLEAGGPQIMVRVGAGPSATRVSRPVFKGVGPEGWYWLESARLSRARPLDEDLFKDLLRGVSDYYELSAH